MDLSMGPHFSITSASLSAFDTIAIIFLVRALGTALHAFRPAAWLCRCCQCLPSRPCWPPSSGPAAAAHCMHHAAACCVGPAPENRRAGGLPAAQPEHPERLLPPCSCRCTTA